MTFNFQRFKRKGNVSSFLIRSLMVGFLFLSLQFYSFGQDDSDNGWTKYEKHELFKKLRSNLNIEYGEDTIDLICVCQVKKIILGYPYKEFKKFIEPEEKVVLRQSKEDCLKALNIFPSKGISTRIKAPKDTSFPTEVKPPSNSAPVEYDRTFLIGVWKDNNSSFCFFADGRFFIKFDEGTSSWGKWWINEKQLFVVQYSSVNFWGDIKYRQIFHKILFKRDNFMKYETHADDSSDQVFDATKIDTEQNVIVYFPELATKK